MLLELDSSLTPAEIRAVYTATALDIEAPGVDRDSGVGIIQADAALAHIQPVPEPVDLTVAKSERQIAPSVSYTVTVTNEGPGDAPNVVVTDTLPDGVTLVFTDGCAEDPTGVPNCSLGSISAGGSKHYSVTVAVSAEGVGLLDTQPSVNSGP